MLQIAAKNALWQRRHCLQDRVRNVLADHGCGLELLLFLWRQAVDSGREHRLDSRWHADRRGSMREPVGAPLANKRPDLDQAPDALLEEEGITFRASGEHSLHRLEACITPEECIE